MAKITPAQARIALKRADIEESIEYLKKGGEFNPVGVAFVNKTKDEAIDLLKGRVAICDNLIELTDEELHNKGKDLIGKLSKKHLAIWMLEMRGFSLSGEEQATAFSEADTAIRIELDLVLIGLGQRP